jgi:hypothetical protein
MFPYSQSLLMFSCHASSYRHDFLHANVATCRVGFTNPKPKANMPPWHTTRGTW